MSLAKVENSIVDVAHRDILSLLWRQDLNGEVINSAAPGAFGAHAQNLNRRLSRQERAAARSKLFKTRTIGGRFQAEVRILAVTEKDAFECHLVSKPLDSVATAELESVEDGRLILKRCGAAGVHVWKKSNCSLDLV